MPCFTGFGERSAHEAAAVSATIACSCDRLRYDETGTRSQRCQTSTRGLRRNGAAPRYYATASGLPSRGASAYSYGWLALPFTTLNHHHHHHRRSHHRRSHRHLLPDSVSHCIRHRDREEICLWASSAARKLLRVDHFLQQLKSGESWFAAAVVEVPCFCFARQLPVLMWRWFELSTFQPDPYNLYVTRLNLLCFGFRRYRCIFATLMSSKHCCCCWRRQRRNCPLFAPVAAGRGSSIWCSRH